MKYLLSRGTSIGMIFALFIILAGVFFVRTTPAAATLLYSNQFQGTPGVKSGDTNVCTYSTDQNHTPGGTTGEKCIDGGALFYPAPRPPAPTNYASFWWYIPSGENLGIDCKAHMYRQYYDGWNWQNDWGLNNFVGDVCDPLATNSPMTLNVAVYGSQAGPGWYGPSSNPFQLITGSWHHVETFFSVNTDGQSNGSAQAWVDGVLVLSVANQKFLTDGWSTRTNPLLDTIQFPSNWGMDSLPDKRIYADDLEIYDGCPAATQWGGIPSCAGVTPDTTPPSTPTGLSASAISSSQINLAWTASADAESGIASYNLYRCSGSSTCTPTLLRNVGNVISTSDTGLAANTTYRYQVSAVNGASLVSGLSTIVTATTQAATLSPVITSSLSASGTVNSSFSYQITATNNPTSYATSVLPQGLSIDTSTGLISGIPTTAATTNITISATNAAGTGSAMLVITINPFITPLASYALNETSGTTAADSSGNANTGTLFGPTWTPAGKYAGALAFNGSTNYVQMPNSTSLNIGAAAITLEAWIYPQDGVADAVVLGKPYTDGSMNPPYYQYAIELDRNGGDQADFFFTDTAGTLYAFSMTSPVIYNTWNHIAFTYDGATIRAYLNGNPAGSTPATGAIIQRVTPLRFGVDATFTQPYQGTIDDVRIYNTALTQTQIQTDMNTPVEGTTPPPPPPPPFDFSLTPTQSSVSVIQGQSILNTITALAISGTSESITFTTSGLPAGATYTYVPSSCIPTLVCLSTLTIQTSASTPPATYPITVTGTAGTLIKTTNFTLIVTPSNSNPTANAGPDQSVMVNSPVILIGSGTDPDGDPLTYAWDFGDSTTGTGAIVIHTYTTIGTYTAMLTVSDGKGGTGTDSAIITVTGSTKFKINDAITVFTGGGKLNVRLTPGGTILGTQANGNKGTIIGGPSFVNNLWWWNVNFTSGVDGWAAEDYMVLTAGSLTPTLDKLTFTAVAPSGQQVSGVQFYLDGVKFGAEDITSPYTTIVTLSTLSAGTHTMKATFRNSSGTLVDTAIFTFNTSGPLSLLRNNSMVMLTPSIATPVSSQYASILTAIMQLQEQLNRLLGR